MSRGDQRGGGGKVKLHRLMQLFATKVSNEHNGQAVSVCPSAHLIYNITEQMRYQ
jgi:hypothetical protein